MGSNVMKKWLLGLLLGGVLGVLDGLSALITSPNAPQVKEGLAGIVIGSTIKGIIAGVIIGIVAQKVNSLLVGIIVGLAVGFLLALPIALLNGVYWEILLPGSMVGLIVGYATQQYGVGSGANPALSDGRTRLS
jgi:hypothetical protein